MGGCALHSTDTPKRVKRKRRKEREDAKTPAKITSVNYTVQEAWICRPELFPIKAKTLNCDMKNDIVDDNCILKEIAFVCLK